MIDILPGKYNPDGKYAHPANVEQVEMLKDGMLFIDPDIGPGVIFKKGDPDTIVSSPTQSNVPAGIKL